MDQLLKQDFWTSALSSIKIWAMTQLPSMVILAIIFIVSLKLLTFSVNKLKKIFINRIQKEADESDIEAEKRVNTLMGIILTTARIALWIMFIMIFLKKIYIDIAPLLAGAGILGLAVGFGSQELVRDVISGFFILLENQVRTGDVAIINEIGGLVEKIQLRTITLRDFSGTVHIIQNGKINSLANMTKEWSAMVFDIGVAYKEDVDRVIHIMKEVGDGMLEDPEFGSLIIEPIEVFGLDEFADSAMVIKARLKTRPIEQWSVGREYRRRLKIAFDKNNIEIPFPHTSIYWGEASDPLQLIIDRDKKKRS